MVWRVSLLCSALHITFLFYTRQAVPMKWKSFNQPGEEGLTWLLLRVLQEKPAASSLETQQGLPAAPRCWFPLWLRTDLTSVLLLCKEVAAEPTWLQWTQTRRNHSQQKLICCLWAWISQRSPVRGLEMFFSVQELWLCLLCISTNLTTAC